MVFVPQQPIEPIGSNVYINLINSDDDQVSYMEYNEESSYNYFLKKNFKTFRR